MGTFVGMSGVIGCGKNAVIEALEALAKENGGAFEKAELTADDDACLVLAEGAAGVTILYPRESLGMNESLILSATLAATVFWFHIHDGDLWTYVLFENGAMIDQFSTLPDYWGENHGGDAGSFAGSPEAIASRIPGVPVESIAKYLVPWSDRHLEGGVLEKAYPTDRFHYGEDWQLLDFVTRLGLDYPLDERGTARGGTYRFALPAGRAL